MSELSCWKKFRDCSIAATNAIGEAECALSSPAVEEAARNDPELWPLVKRGLEIAQELAERRAELVKLSAKAGKLLEAP